VEREQLRAIFDEAAELYDRARPGYPPQLFEDLAELAGLQPGARVLEIGPGTGQATLPLAERGYAITAVELGPDLAAVARRKLARFPSLEIVVGAFEQWPLPDEPFDLVISATAFHWLDPAIRVTRSADALRPGGTLATISTHHIAGEHWDPATPPGLRLEPADVIPRDSAEIEESGRFVVPPVFRRYEWEHTYSTAEYLDLLHTYSGHRALDQAARTGLIECIRQLIDARHGGSISKRYMTELRAAQVR
jgi:SAM-dependent methyltransferase